jgi:endonuclease III
MNKQLQIINGGSGNKPVTTKIKLNYLSEKKARKLIEMFDNEHDYKKNFAALKTIGRGLYKTILDQSDRGEQVDPIIKKLFHTVNHLQGLLIPDDPSETESILRDAGL